MENKKMIVNDSNSFNWQPETYYYVGEKRYTAEEFNNAVEMLKNPQLNENQQILLEWLKEEHFNLYVKSVLSNLYFYINMTAIGDLESVKIQEMINAYEKLSKVEFAQVIEVFSRWALEQEDENE